MKRFALLVIPTVAVLFAMIFVSATPAQAQYRSGGFSLHTGGGVHIQIGNGRGFQYYQTPRYNAPRYQYYPNYPNYPNPRYPQYPQYPSPRYPQYPQYPRYPQYDPYPHSGYPSPYPPGRLHYDPYHGWHYDR